MVVQRYQELYSQERVEALDAIEGAEGVTIGKEWGMGSAGKRNFGMRLMLDVLKVCHSVCVCVWGGGGYVHANVQLYPPMSIYLHSHHILSLPAVSPVLLWRSSTESGRVHLG